MIRHHPHDDLLMAHAAGSLSPGLDLVVEVHLEACEACRARASVFDAVGGALLEALPPTGLAADALARTLAAIDAPRPAPSVEARRSGRLPTLPAGMAWPRALQACDATGWRWIAPGMAMSRVRPAEPTAEKVLLLRIGAGASLPRHTHRGIELTQVLHGAFHDGRSLFAPGDFDRTDASVHHEPEVTGAGDCVCLSVVSGSLRFEGWLARWMGTLAGV